MTHPVADLLRQAADVVEKDPKVYFAQVLNNDRLREGSGLTYLDASEAVNIYLSFPMGTWFSWQDERGAKKTVRMLRSCAEWVDAGHYDQKKGPGL